MKKDNDQLIKIYGAGLSGALLALRLQDLGYKNIQIFDKNEVSLPDRTWSFFKSDISRENYQWLSQYVDYAWDSHSVFFPKFQRELNWGYASIRSENLRKKLKEKFSDNFFVGNYEIEDNKNNEFKSAIKIDARGIFLKQPCGFQKFVGLDLETNQPHGLKSPIIMDARVEQIDGYRFMYVLPLSLNELLVEDTVYSDDAKLDREEYKKRILKYVSQHFSGVRKVIREEFAALPIPLKNIPNQSKNIVLGMSSGIFHPVTGYSLPMTIRHIDLICRHINDENLHSIATQYVSNEINELNYYYLLNRMMFGAASNIDRIQIFNRFYQMQEGFIQRFYSGKLSRLDKIRMLSGKPPVRISKAMKSIFTNSWMENFNAN